ncbi:MULTISPECIES: hypothetical protein [Bacillus cereus group]|uniref:hypothetical protein n=1 Tax=Bacillus cereus group TaxID=86661 RepID=UPI001F588845|nr:hypothetical protein [Bacillus cereus]
MTFEERRILREKLIRESYNHHFENVEEEFIFQINWGNRESEETHLAYRYLEEKGLIYYISTRDGKYEVRINAHGIDHVEK